MGTPVLKCDLLVETSNLKSCFRSFNSFEEFLDFILRKAMQESGNHLNDEEIKKIIDENSLINFKVFDIAFRLKLV